MKTMQKNLFTMTEFSKQIVTAIKQSKGTKNTEDKKMKKYLVESTHGNERDTEGLPIYVNAVGDYTYADSEEEAIEIYKDTCIEQGASEEENEAANYIAERVVPSYDEIRDAWFADGYHTDEFETLENFVDWLHEHNLYLDDDTIQEDFYCLQKERAEHNKNM